MAKGAEGDDLRKLQTQLSTFVPEIIKFILGKEDRIEPPKFWSFQGVGMWADVRGFTAMTEELSKRGPQGTEMLSQKLNSYLAQIVKEIINSGGDIIKFAGDAVLSVWAPPIELLRSNDIAAQKALLSENLARVIQCALDIQKNWGELQLKDAPALTVKLGIGVGDCAILVIGGTRNRCEYLACGDAFLQAFECEGDCDGPRQVVVSTKCHTMMTDKFMMKPFKDNGNYMVHKKKGRGIPKKALDIVEIKSAAFAKKLAQYVPSAVVPHLMMPSLFWAGELRQVTVMFLSLPFKATQVRTLGKSIVKKIQDTIVTLQQTIYQFHGSLNKFLVDDKGSTVIAVFGLPPVAHDNDAERAVMAALKLKERLLALQKTQATQGEVLTKINHSSLADQLAAMKQRKKRKSRKKKKRSSLTVPGGASSTGGDTSRPSVSVSKSELSTTMDRSTTLDALTEKSRSPSDLPVIHQSGQSGSTISLTGSIAAATPTPVDSGLASVSAGLRAEHEEKKSDKIEKETAIGLASGVVFLGLVGGQGSRREYSFLGDYVNLSARLMGEAAKYQDRWGSIAVDESVVAQCIGSDHINWTFMGEKKVKGREEPAQIWKPSRKLLIVENEQTLVLDPSDSKRIRDGLLGQPWKDQMTKLLDTGDHREISKANSRLNEMCKNGPGSVVLVESEVAMGKTSLLMRCMRQAETRCWFLWAQGNWLHEELPKSPWIVWRQILQSFQEKFPLHLSALASDTSSGGHGYSGGGSSIGGGYGHSAFGSTGAGSPLLLGVHDHPDREHLRKSSSGSSISSAEITNRELFGEYIRERRGDLFEWLFLLNDLIPVADLQSAEMELRSFPEWDYLSTINQEKKRAQKNQQIVKFALYDIIMCLLEWAAHRYRPIVIVLDEFQWLRRHDWDFTRRLIAHIKEGVILKVSVFLGCSPMDNRRYKPHFIDFKGNYAQQYTRLRKYWIHLRLTPHRWGVQKVRAFIISLKKQSTGFELEQQKLMSKQELRRVKELQKKQQNVVQVSVELVEVVHSLCGGRPGFCRPFVIQLFKSNDPNGVPITQLSEMRTKDEYRLEFTPYISDRIKRNKLRFGIPPSIVAVTARQMDIMSPELSLCLTSAAVICVAQGLTHTHFRVSELIGVHPIQDFAERERIMRTLDQLKRMKFIDDRKEAERTGGESGGKTGIPGEAGHSKSGRRRRKSAGYGLKFHGTKTQDIFSDDEDEDDLLLDGAAGMSRYGGHSSGYSHPHQRSDGMITGVDHSRKKGGISSDLSDVNNGLLSSDVKKKTLPKSKDILKEPKEGILYMKGTLFKKKYTLSKETERVFVFKGRNLYWLKSETDKYPCGKLHFDQVLRIQRKGRFQIKMSLRGGIEYTFRGTKQKEMDRWLEVFQMALDTFGSDPSTAAALSAVSSRDSVVRKSMLMSGGEEKVIDEDDLIDHEYVFTYGFLRDNVYNQTLFEQRTKIHGKAVQFYRERGHSKLSETHQLFIKEFRRNLDETDEPVIIIDPQAGRTKEVREKREETVEVVEKKKKKKGFFGF